MVSHAPIARDARVRKTATSVKQLGYKVTLVYGAREVPDIEYGDIDGVKTIGVPMHFLLALKRPEELEVFYKELWRPFYLGYRESGDRREAERRLAVMAARRPTDRPNRLLFRWLKTWHTFRSGLLYTRRKTRRRQEAHLNRKRQKWDWRRELPMVGDYEATLTPWLERLAPDILHIHDVEMLWGGVNAKQFWKDRGKHVALIYDSHEYVAGTHYKIHVQNAYSAMELEAAPHVDAAITVCEPIADLMIDRLPLPARPTVVLNTPRLSSVDGGSKRSLRQELGLSGDTPLLVYTGTLRSKRNLKRAVEALPFLPEVHFAVVGVPDVTGGYAELLVDTAAELEISDRLHMVSPVAPEEVIPFISSATVGLHPIISGVVNHEVALPNKLFDYVFAGLPVAVSDLPEMSRFVSQYGIGHVFDPLEPESIAAAVRRVLDDYEALARSANNPQLRQEYSWEAQETKLASVYNGLGGW